MNAANALRPPEYWTAVGAKSAAAYRARPPEVRRQRSLKAWETRRARYTEAEIEAQFLGRAQSPESRAKLSLNNGSRRAEVRAKLREARKNTPRASCVNCHREFAVHNLIMHQESEALLAALDIDLYALARKLEALQRAEAG